MLHPVDDTSWLAATPGGVGAVASWTQPDGSTRLASSGSDHTVRIWNPSTGSAIGNPLIGHTAALWGLTVWTDGTGHAWLASSGEDHTIRMWDPETGLPLGDPLTGHSGWVVSLASWTSQDGRARLASASLDGTVRLWDVATGVQLGDALTDHTSPVWAVRHWLTPDGRRHLATTGDDGTVLTWDVDAATPKVRMLASLPGGQWDLAAWRTMSGEPRLASAGTDGTIHVWNPVSGHQIGQPLTGHSAAARSLTTWQQPSSTASRPAGTTILASAGADGTIRFWDPETGGTVAEPLTGYSGWLPSLTSWVEPDGGVRIASAGDNGAIQVWDFASMAPVGTAMVGHTSALWALASWTRGDGSVRLASAGDDGLIRIWNTDTGAQVGQPLTGHTAGVWGLTASPDQDGEVRLASAGDDGMVRIWASETGEPVGDPLVGHSGWIPGLTSWVDADGVVRLASAGIDGTIRIWNATDVVPVDPPMSAGAGWMMCLTAWTAGDGHAYIASGGADGAIRIWDPETCTIVGDPLRGHDGWVRGLTSWTGANGPRLGSAGFDHTVRIWDAETRTQVGAPLTGHTALVSKVISWTDRTGREMLASGSDDSTIRIWDAQTGAQVGEPLLGHTSGVWALTTWTASDGSTRMASAGYDGTVRLWDLDRRIAIRTIEVGQLTMWGLSDAPTSRDALGREELAEAVADQLRGSRISDGRDHGGPTVVSIEGPWGCGKTTLMEMIRQRLPAPSTSPKKPGPRLTVREAVALTSRYSRRKPVDAPTAPDYQIMITAWFNPWAHESGQQVWAGLVHEITEAAGRVLYPAEPDRQRYWLTRNLSRVDRFAVRRMLLRRVVSPFLGVALVAITPLAVAFTQVNWRLHIFHHSVTVTALALAMAVVSLLAGLLLTAARYWWNPAARFLPAELLHRAVSDEIPSNASDSRSEAIVDPLRRARAGSLYLYQHDVAEILADLATVHHEMIIFIDDLDRCRASTTGEVFEAVNLFLSGLTSDGRMHARFVIGLDPVVVAGHLDGYSGQALTSAVPFGDDASPGWAYLRKLIQLPVIVPQVSDAGISHFVEQITTTPRPPTSATSSRTSAVLVPTAPPVLPTMDTSRSDRHIPRAREPHSAAPAHGVPDLNRAETIPWRALEQHPEVTDLVIARLGAQPDRSIREAKRMLNVWQLYQRILSATDPVSEPQAIIARARNLVLLAEIVTRWPALQRQLHRRFGPDRGLQILARSVDDDTQWAQAVNLLWPGPAANRVALTNLRELMRSYGGDAVSELGAMLL
jgi:WD40 repeat protein